MADTAAIFNQYKGSPNIILAYSGDVYEELFTVLLDLSEKKLNKVEFKSRVRKKIFNILVELFQNIQNHYRQLEDELQGDYSIFIFIEKENRHYRIVSGNNVLNKNVDVLRSRLDEINEMSFDEIKVKYRERLDSGRVSEGGGAGLGMLDIVRKSGDKIKYNFDNINDTFSFFQLTINVTA